MSNICKGCGGFIQKDDLLCWACSDPELNDLINNYENKKGVKRYE